jgi:hypothetical protein
MISAFGVDHGSEIAKFGAPGLGRIGAKLGSVVGSAGMKLGRAGTGNLKAAKIAGAGPGAAGVKRLGMGQQRLGGGLNRLGTGMMRRPGLTGGLAVGGGAAGGGAALGSLNNRRRTY